MCENETMSRMLPRLHGRRVELQRLLEVCPPSAEGPRLVVMLGKRRVGKTFLLTHLADRLRRQGGKVIQFTATREAGDLQLARLATDSSANSTRAITSWSDLWDEIALQAETEPTTVLIDEAPYLIDIDPSWPSALQAAWDRVRHRASPPALTVVLTGSAISTMTRLISSRGALFERPDLQLRLEPFDLPTAASYLAAPTPISALEAFAACDGYPMLLDRWDASLPALDNLIALGSDPLAPLVANGSTLLLDLGDYDAHARVLRAIGRGAHKLAEINSRAGQRTERPLHVLERAGLVRRLHPIGSKAKQQLRVAIADNYLQFWFSLIDAAQPAIDGGQGEQAMRRATPAWNRHVESVFEEQARRHGARAHIAPGVVGQWWTDRPTQAQIDVVVDGESGWTLAGEAKCRSRFGRADLHQLERNISIAGREGIQLAAWSIDGVSDELRAQRPGLLSFTAADMVAGRSS